MCVLCWGYSFADVDAASSIRLVTALRWGAKMDVGVSFGGMVVLMLAWTP